MCRAQDGVWRFVTVDKKAVGQGDGFDLTLSRNRIRGDQIQVDRAGAAETNILKCKYNVAAIGAEGGVAITAIAFEGCGVFGFVGEGAVKRQVAKAIIADVAIEEEEQVAVPVEVDDLVGKLKTTTRKLIHDRGGNGFAVAGIYNSDGIGKDTVGVGNKLNGKAFAIV